MMISAHSTTPSVSSTSSAVRDNAGHTDTLRGNRPGSTIIKRLVDWGVPPSIATYGSTTGTQTLDFLQTEDTSDEIEMDHRCAAAFLAADRSLLEPLFSAADCPAAGTMLHSLLIGAAIGMFHTQFESDTCKRFVASFSSTNEWNADLYGHIVRGRWQDRRLTVGRSVPHRCDQLSITAADYMSPDVVCRFWCPAYTSGYARTIVQESFPGSACDLDFSLACDRIVCASQWFAATLAQVTALTWLSACADKNLCDLVDPAFDYDSLRSTAYDLLRDLCASLVQVAELLVSEVRRAVVRQCGPDATRFPASTLALFGPRGRDQGASGLDEASFALNEANCDGALHNLKVALEDRRPAYDIIAAWPNVRRAIQIAVTGTCVSSLQLRMRGLMLRCGDKPGDFANLPVWLGAQRLESTRRRGTSKGGSVDESKATAAYINRYMSRKSDEELLGHRVRWVPPPRYAAMMAHVRIVASLHALAIEQRRDERRAGTPAGRYSGPEHARADGLVLHWTDEAGSAHRLPLPSDAEMLALLAQHLHPARFDAPNAHSFVGAFQDEFDRQVRLGLPPEPESVTESATYMAAHDLVATVLRQFASAEAATRGVALAADSVLKSNVDATDFLTYRLFSLPEVFEPLKQVAWDVTLRLGVSRVYRATLDQSDATLDVCYTLWRNWFQQHSKYVLPRIDKQLKQCKNEAERQRLEQGRKQLDLTVAAARHRAKLGAIAPLGGTVAEMAAEASVSNAAPRQAESASPRGTKRGASDLVAAAPSAASWDGSGPEGPLDGQRCQCEACGEPFDFQWATCMRLCGMESVVRVRSVWCATCSENAVSKKRRAD